jgi:hypothetical protein
MGRQISDESEARFEAYIDGIVSVMSIQIGPTAARLLYRPDDIGQGARGGAAWIEGHGPITAWIIDDTRFPKKGRHSVRVARQNRSP